MFRRSKNKGYIEVGRTTAELVGSELVLAPRLEIFTKNIQKIPAPDFYHIKEVRMYGKDGLIARASVESLEDFRSSSSPDGNIVLEFTKEGEPDTDRLQVNINVTNDGHHTVQTMSMHRICDGQKIDGYVSNGYVTFQ